MQFLQENTILICSIQMSQVIKGSFERVLDMITEVKKNNQNFCLQYSIGTFKCKASDQQLVVLLYVLCGQKCYQCHYV